MDGDALPTRSQPLETNPTPPPMNVTGSSARSQRSPYSTAAARKPANATASAGTVANWLARARPLTEPADCARNVAARVAMVTITMMASSTVSVHGTDSKRVGRLNRTRTG